MTQVVSDAVARLAVVLDLTPMTVPRGRGLLTDRDGRDSPNGFESRHTGIPWPAGLSTFMDVAGIEGMEDLWRESLGDPEVCVAILDGPVDRSHPSFAGADLTARGSGLHSGGRIGEASCHGTHVASLLFGQPGGPVRGVSPRCRGLIIPIFDDDGAGRLAPCDQGTLARAIRTALDEGASLINVSGGEPSSKGDAAHELAEAVRACADRDVLIVAAAGNDGCECLQVPGALPSVLAVGAMDDDGEPLEFSNWGAAYRRQGLLAPGERIMGARPGGGVDVRSGTSYAAPIVTGVAALLLSLLRRLGRPASPFAVRAALLNSARDDGPQDHVQRRRLLAGRLNIPGAVASILQGASEMSATYADDDSTSESECTLRAPALVRGANAATRRGANAATRREAPVLEKTETSLDALNQTSLADRSATHGQVAPADCGCAACRGTAALAKPQLAYALGEIGYDFGIEARHDSIKQHMAVLPHPVQPSPMWGEEANPYDPAQLLRYLDDHPWDAASVIWTLNVEAIPIYAIVPHGPFASEICKRLREYLQDQLRGVERVSLPGVIGGPVRLQSGQLVPTLLPELRGMYNWKTGGLAEHVLGAAPSAKAPAKDRQDHDRRHRGFRNFLERVYYELRNLGVRPEDRAINFAATQTFEVGQVYSRLSHPMELDRIEVERSPLCRPESDCWDVKLLFFNPESQVQTVRKVFRHTVDVSDVVPVTLGRLREWFVR